MASNTSIVMWSYQSRGLVFVFEPNISNEIENTREANKKGSNKTYSINLGVLSPQFSSCTIDLGSPSPILIDTKRGISKRVERIVCPQDSFFAQKVWEFDGNGSWAAFDIKTANVIEDAVAANKGKLDLSLKSGLPYKIDLKHLIQTNIKTGKQRNIRKRDLSQSYSPDTLGSSLNLGSFTNHAPNIARSKSHKNRLGANLHTVPLGRSQTSNASAKPSAEYSCSSNDDNPPKRPVHSVTLPKLTEINLPKLDSVTPESEADPISQFTKKVSVDDLEEDDDQDCAICFDKLSEESGPSEGEPNSGEVARLVNCRHVFHKYCLLEMYKHSNRDGFLQCPKCKSQYGEKVGDCPAGKMKWELFENMSLPGHEESNILEVTYDIPSGTQVQGHPKPGEPFKARGFPRVAFIPDSDKGRKVLKLLMVAFKRRLMFTVGTSTTTGEECSVIWNDIHHKTEAMSNLRGHGYPDPLYLDNALMELAAHGITEKCLED